MSAKAIYTRNPDFDDTPGIGAKNVTTAGTAVALAAATPCTSVLIQAKRSNGGRIYVGGSTIANDDTGGVFLETGDVMSIDTTDLSNIYLNSTVSGEGVTYIYSK